MQHFNASPEHCASTCARQLVLETAWVNPEAVSKMRLIETNDTGKTDLKDPRVIHSLACMGKLLLSHLASKVSVINSWIFFSVPLMPSSRICG